MSIEISSNLANEEDMNSESEQSGCLTLVKSRKELKREIGKHNPVRRMISGVQAEQQVIAQPKLFLNAPNF